MATTKGNAPRFKSRIAQAALLLAVAMSLAGCWDKKLAWRDITGKSRGNEIALQDKSLCYRNLPSPSAHAASAERQAALERALDCMKRRGWLLNDY